MKKTRKTSWRKQESQAEQAVIRPVRRVRERDSNLSKKDWWSCTGCGKLQKYFFPTVIGENKLCVYCNGNWLWTEKIPKKSNR
jgi:hypothetical protein